MKVPAYVKTSLSPGSRVVSEYFENSGLQKDLNQLGFNVTGFGCMTCIGNSGDLKEDLSKLVEANKDMIFASVLSGNRNFEGRVHPLTRANYLAAPVYVVAYALAGHIDINFDKEPLGTATDGHPVFLRDIFPKDDEVNDLIRKYVTRELFINNYGGNYLIGNENWEQLAVEGSPLYAFDPHSTYIRNPPYFDKFAPEPKKIGGYTNLRSLLVVGDSITTDHISPAGNISKTSSAAKYLQEHGVGPKDFNSYGARRGNHEVMVRGTFANITIKNQLIPGIEGPLTVTKKGEAPIPIFEAAERNGLDNLIVFAGKEYGAGSSRDWAAKGPKLQGVKVVIAESYERIHRSNLIGMAVVPLQFQEDQTLQSLGLTGFETFNVNLEGLKPKGLVSVEASNGVKFQAIARIDTDIELEYLYHDGILPYVLRKLLKKQAAK
jgi:aconitate hydratase